MNNFTFLLLYILMYSFSVFDNVSLLSKVYRLLFTFPSTSPFGILGGLCFLGPVVQSIVSLTSSLRGQLVKCCMTL